MESVSLLVVGVAAVLAPLLSVATRKVVPGIIFEILLGIAIGPSLLGWVAPGGFVDELGTVGVSLLMFIAGTEVNLQDFRGDSLRRAGGSWLASVGLAALVGLGIALLFSPDAALLIAIGLSTTALGTLLPILRDKGILEIPFGRATMTMGAVAEFGPIVLISLLLTSSRGPLPTLLFIAGFALLIWLTILGVRHVRPARLRRVLAAGIDNPSQLPVRVALVVVLGLALIAEDSGIDPLLGAFCAGLVVRQAIKTDSEEFVHLFDRKIEAVGFGFLIPVFFIVCGVKIDVPAMVASPGTFALVPAFALAFLLTRGLPVFFAYRSSLGTPDAKRLGLLAASAISLVVVVANIGQDSGALSPALAAAFVAGGLLTVAVFPALALRGVSAPAESAGDLGSRS